MMITNLYEETVEMLRDYGKTEGDVAHVQGSHFYFTWEEFAKVAKVTNYNDGFGAQEVASDLKVVGYDFWLEREEYDGSEGWKFKKMPTRPHNHHIPEKLAGGMWSDLSSLNGK